MSNFDAKKAFIDKNGFYISTPHGKSMLPFIREEGDTAVIFPLSTVPKKFDVVFYRRADGTYVLHRIVRIKKNGYIIRGDNCYYDEYISKEQVIGIAEKLFRKGNTHRNLFEKSGYRTKVRIWVLIYPLRFSFHFAVSTLKKTINICKSKRRK